MAKVQHASLRLEDGSTLQLTVSVGVAHSPAHATGMREIYAVADRALYRAKRSGRNQAMTATSYSAV